MRKVRCPPSDLKDFNVLKGLNDGGARMAMARPIVHQIRKPEIFKFSNL